MPSTRTQLRARMRRRLVAPDAAYQVLGLAALVFAGIGVVAVARGDVEQPPLTVALLLALTAVFFLAGRLRRRGDGRSAALVTAFALLAAGPTFAGLTDQPAATDVIGPMAFILALPYADRRQLLAVAAFSVGASLVPVLAGFVSGTFAHGIEDVAIVVAPPVVSATTLWLVWRLYLYGFKAHAQMVEATALIGPTLRRRERLSRERGRIARVLAAGEFQPFFQPILSLDDQRVVGYEALTRFDDGASAGPVFAAAGRAGLGRQLELAALAKIWSAFDTLATTAFINVNVSPDLIMAGEPLISLLQDAEREVVIEITEHTAIADYDAFRRAVAKLPCARLAVDDAGAGYASLRHILEIRPAIIKLDRALVAGIDADPSRRALVAGMVQFGRETKTMLIAEGIETVGELMAVRSLGVAFGQGFLLGAALPAGRGELIAA